MHSKKELNTLKRKVMNMWRIHAVKALNCFMLFHAKQIEVDNLYKTLSDSHRFYVLGRLGWPQNLNLMLYIL